MDSCELHSTPTTKFSGLPRSLPLSAERPRGTHAWFESPGRRAWAICPLTENGLVRVVSSPGYPGRRTTLDDAIWRLRAFCEHEDHLFWPDSVTIRDSELFESASIQGYRRLTDIYLLALAVANHGALVTLDRSIGTSGVSGAREDHVTLLSA